MKSTAAILATAMFVGDHMTASTSLARQLWYDGTSNITDTKGAFSLGLTLDGDTC